MSRKRKRHVKIVTKNNKYPLLYVVNVDILFKKSTLFLDTTTIIHTLSKDHSNLRTPISYLLQAQQNQCAERLLLD